MRACSHRLVFARCWPVKPKSSPGGFFMGALTGLRSIAMGLYRLRGRKDTQHYTPCLGSSLSARDWSSQRESGGTRPLMNESLRHALSGSATFATLGRRWSATTPWESIVKKRKDEPKSQTRNKTHRPSRRRHRPTLLLQLPTIPLGHGRPMANLQRWNQPPLEMRSVSTQNKPLTCKPFP